MTVYPSQTTDVVQRVDQGTAKELRYAFFCPACKTVHHFGSTWGLTGSLSRPNVAHSILAKFTKDLTEDEVNMVLAGRDFEPQQVVCHTQINNGSLYYYPDSTNGYDNKTVPMPLVQDPDWVAYRQQYAVPFQIAGA